MSPLAWIVVGSFTGPFAGKLASVSTNDNTAFLPASAESTRVNDELAKFQDTSYIPAIVVAERSSGFTDADATYLTDTITPLAGTEGFGKAFSPAIRSADGKAAELIVPISTAGEPADTVEGSAERRALADVAVRLGPAPAGQSYLSIERVLDTARRTADRLLARCRAVEDGEGVLVAAPTGAGA